MHVFIFTAMDEEQFPIRREAQNDPTNISEGLSSFQTILEPNPSH